MGANCVSDGRKICQNDLQISQHVSNYPKLQNDYKNNKEDLKIEQLEIERKNS